MEGNYSKIRDIIWNRATTRRKQGNFVEAVNEYELIIREHPQALMAHIGLIEMAAYDMKNASIVQSSYERAMNLITAPNHVEALKIAYESAITAVGRM